MEMILTSIRSVGIRDTNGAAQIALYLHRQDIDSRRKGLCTNGTRIGQQNYGPIHGPVCISILYCKQVVRASLLPYIWDGVNIVAKA